MSSNKNRKGGENMKVILKPIPDSNEYSIESGLHDGLRHFDHHGKFTMNLPVCLQDIPVIPNDSCIYITHIDADTLKGVSKMMGKNFASDINWQIVGIIDSNGPEYMDENIRDRAFMIGIGHIARKLEIPREGDVTDKILNMLDTPSEEYIRLGLEEMKKSKLETIRSIVKLENDIALVDLPKNIGLDALALYKIGASIIVTYRNSFKTISIMGSKVIKPSPIPDLRREWSGIKFEGHPLACGSPRDKEYELSDAYRVYDEIKKEISIKGGN